MLPRGGSGNTRSWRRRSGGVPGDQRSANRRARGGLTSGDALRLHQGQEKEHGQDFDDFRDDTERVEILDVPNRPHGDCPCDDVCPDEERGDPEPRPIQILVGIRDEEGRCELEAREHAEERCRERLSQVIVERIQVEGSVREEEERDQVPFRHLAVAQDLWEIIVCDADRGEGDAEHREENAQLKRSRAVSARERVELEDTEEVRQPADDDDEEPAQKERQFGDRGLLAAHSPPPKVVACKKFPVFTLQSVSFPKAFMGFRTNPAFRSRSLVRSRIVAFRASDAGSNPAGSMLFCNTPNHSTRGRNALDTQLAVFGCRPTRLVCRVRAVLTKPSFRSALQPPRARLHGATTALVDILEKRESSELNRIAERRKHMDG